VRILALETSSLHGSVSTLLGDKVLSEVDLTGEKRTAQSLAPAMQSLLETVGWKPNEIELVAVTVGPGSFTGLRVGVVTAKTLAYATGAAVIGVNTLDVIAFQSRESCGIISAVINAHRRQLFTKAFYRVEGGTLNMDQETLVVEVDDYLANLQPNTIVTGPFLEQLKERLPSNVSMADKSVWHPSAATVGQLAWLNYQSGKRDDLWTLAPKYYRQSAAEEKLAGSKPKVLPG